MNPDSPGFPATLGELTEVLKGWRAHILSELEERVRGCRVACWAGGCHADGMFYGRAARGIIRRGSDHASAYI